MILDDLFKLLSYGELVNLMSSVDGTGTIKKEQQNRIVAFTNEGLKRLHSRFRLKETREELTITAVAQDHTFPTAALQVYSIYTVSDTLPGQSIAFGNTPVAGTLYVSERILHLPALPAGNTNIKIQVTYYKRHPELIPVTDATGLLQEIDLTPELHEALTAYIAQKVFGGMASQDAQATAQAHRARYDQVCIEASNQGLTPGELEYIRKLEYRGFV